ncbi:efflux RND transporter periplasmic adaptor subunit [Haliangium sp.]|uniref:efflux RND transporter periplasmic adaptor subunit n=1 Tax=Haliangium sp. TaxID=2663208 RepID=UPI003D10C48E
MGPARLACAGLLLIGVTTGLGCTESKPAAPAQAQADKAPPPAVVTLAEARAGTITDGWSFLGRVEAALAAELAAAVPGHVLTVSAREGDRVNKGTPLVALDSAKARATVAAAQARIDGLERSLEFSRRQLERLASLSYPTVSEPEKDRQAREVADLEAQLATQQAELRRLQVELAQHTVRAPFAGVVRARHVDPGAWVSPGQAVIDLVALDDLEVIVDVSDRLAGRVEVGHEVTLHAAGRSAEAEVRGVVGALDPATRTMRTRVIPLAPVPDWLLAGMAVDVEFPVTLAAEDLAGAVIVPADAVIRGPVDSRVVKHVDGAGVTVQVEILGQAGAEVMVRGDGLAPGDQVVVRGNERLRPGQPLQVTPALGRDGDTKAGPESSGG